MGKKLARLTPNSDRLVSFKGSNTVHLVMYSGEVWVGKLVKIEKDEVTLVINKTSKRQVNKASIAEIIVDL